MRGTSGLRPPGKPGHSHEGDARTMGVTGQLATGSPDATTTVISSAVSVFILRMARPGGIAGNSLSKEILAKARRARVGITRTKFHARTAPG